MRVVERQLVPWWVVPALTAVVLVSAILFIGTPGPTAPRSGTFNLSAAPMSKYDSGPFVAPFDVAFTPTDAWITDVANNAVVEVNAATGHLVRKVRGTQGRFDGPDRIAASSTDLWVNGQGAHFANTISELNSSNGSFVRTLKRAGGDLAVCGRHLWAVGGSDYFEYSVTSGRLQRAVNLSKMGIWLGGDLSVEGNDLWSAGGRGRTNVAVELSCSTSSVLKVLDVGNSAAGDVGGIAVSGDHLWITTGPVLAAAEVREFNTTTGAMIRAIRSARYDFYDGSIAATSNVVCVVSQGGARVALVNGSTGSLIKMLSSDLFFPEITLVAAHGGDFWLLSTEGSAVVVINAETGRIVHYLGPTGGPTGGAYPLGR